MIELTSNKREALKYIAEYYENAQFNFYQIEKREFGIGLIKKIDARHLAFQSVEQFRKYLLVNTPLFVSHSTAYYGYPAATPIQKKGWGGADIVFDLDMHAEGKYEVYKKLEEAKQDAIRLAEDFLKADFGIDEILYVFSGNRGYHLHIRDKNFIEIGGEERKELVDYIRGNGLNYINFFEEREVPGRRINQWIGPLPSEAGYRGKFARKVVQILREHPQEISRKFKKEEEQRVVLEGIEKGNWSMLEGYKDKLAQYALELPLTSVDTDAGVTQDLSKLIRVPNSIHGETGLVAKVVDTINSFDPLKDAALKEKGERIIQFIEDVPEIEFLDTTFGPFKKDKKNELPIAAALFFVLKGSADFIL